MRNRLLASVGIFSTVIAVVSLPPVPAAGQSATATAATKPSSSTQTKTWTAPRTPWGDPDLQGIWTNIAENAVPLERPPEFAGKEVLNDKDFAAKMAEKAARDAAAGGRVTIGPPDHWGEGGRAPGGAQSRRTSVIVEPPDGRLPPLTPEAQKRAEARAAVRAAAAVAAHTLGPVAEWESLHVWDRCITRGLPDSMFPRLYNSNYQILQTPEYVAILYEMIHDARIIPLDGRSHLSPNIRHWMGDSRGHWEGNTLVVDTTNFTAKTEFKFIPHGGGGTGSYLGAGETLHLVERFTRVDANTIDYRFTIDDPKLYMRPWTGAIPLTTNGSPDQILEYACHEGNYGTPHRLSGARAVQKAAQEAAKQK